MYKHIVALCSIKLYWIMFQLHCLKSCFHYTVSCKKMLLSIRCYTTKNVHDMTMTLYSVLLQHTCCYMPLCWIILYHGCCYMPLCFPRLPYAIVWSIFWHYALLCCVLLHWTHCSLRTFAVSYWVVVCCKPLHYKSRMLQYM